jgi:hypothetical protein
MRDFSLVVPGDCVVSNTKEENRNALEQMRKILKADIRPSTELDLEELAKVAIDRTRPHPQPAHPAETPADREQGFPRT